MSILTMLSILAIVSGLKGIHEYIDVRENSPATKMLALCSFIFLFLLSDAFDFHSASFGFNGGCFLLSRLWFPIQSIFIWRKQRKRQAQVRAFERECEQAQLDSLRIPQRERVAGTFPPLSRDDQEKLVTNILSSPQAK